MQSLNFLLAAAIAAASPAAIHSQTGNWQIDPAHSTASLNLTASTQAGRPYNLAIALVAGRLDVDMSKPGDAVVTFSIFPAAQGPSPVAQDGTFRSGSFGTLTRYTLLSFQSDRTSLAADGKLVVTGLLTAEHVQRRASIIWSDAYTGPTYSDSLVDHFAGKATFTLDLSAAAHSKGQDPDSQELSASAVIKQADFPGLWSALRSSEWPVVVFDKKCEMPYYPGPSLRDYKGPNCTGKPVLVASPDGLAFTPPAIEAIGSVVPVPPMGDQVAIVVHLRLIRARADSKVKPAN